jgi:hypothetical protein
MKKMVSKEKLRELGYRSVLLLIQVSVVMFIWNMLVVDLYDIRSINALEGVALIVLSKLLINFNTGDVYKEVFKDEDSK